MAEPIGNESSPPAPDVARLVLHDGPHRWSFTFTVDDVDLVIDRVAELVRDAAVPFDEAAGHALLGEILRVFPLTNSSQPESENADLSPETRRRGGSESGRGRSAGPEAIGDAPIREEPSP